jgi:hypothetical protein
MYTVANSMGEKASAETFEQAKDLANRLAGHFGELSVYIKDRDGREWIKLPGQQQLLQPAL